MNKALKWTLIAGVIGVVLGLVIVIAAIMLIDVDQLKGKVETQVAERTGRTFSVGNDWSLSFFPWIGVTFNDLKLGSPEGFSEEVFLSIEDFEARLRLLPLLRKEIEVKRFVVHNPRIVLEKRADGSTSWDFGKPTPADTGDKASQPAGQDDIAIGALDVQEFSVTGGKVLWIDQQTPQRIEVTELNLKLDDLSFTRPIGVDISARVDKYPLAVKGRIGPLGQPIGADVLEMDLSINLLEELTVAIKGGIDKPLENPVANLALSIPQISLRSLAGRYQAGLLPDMNDPKALDRVSLKADIQASAQRVEISDGVIGLDDSEIKLALDAKDLDKPDLTAQVVIDAIDVDRYLPKKGDDQKTAAKPPAEADSQPVKDSPIDFDPLRRLVLAARLNIGQLTVSGARMQDIDLQLAAKDGVFTLKPLKSRLYNGDINVNGMVDVRKDQPKVVAKLKIAQIEAGPLLKDTAQKDIIEGLMDADLQIETIGLDADQIKRNLNGQGQLLFKDGAIVGIDLAAMVRNVQAAFTGEGQVQEKPKTDFAELSLPFGLHDGVFKTTATRLTSPLLRVNAAGQADLNQETLDFRVQPKFVATIVGQGDTEERKGVRVPVIVEGTFAEPQFRPDLAAMAKQQVEEQLIQSGKFNEIFEKNEDLKPLEGTAKGLLDGLLGTPPKKKQ